jgi:hypothetical protein
MTMLSSMLMAYFVPGAFVEILPRGSARGDGEVEMMAEGTGAGP